MSDLNSYEEGLAIDLARAEARIKELEAENKRLDKNALAAFMMGFDDGRCVRASVVWREFKDKWDGEKKFALREVVKYLKGEDDVDTAVDTDVSGAAELHHVELYQTLEECTADMWEIAPRLEKHEAMLCMEANI